jgi:dynein heavy chain
MLNSGEVPNLWPADEKAVVIDETRELNEKKKRPEDPDTIYKTFVEKVRNDLHIVLCMSPVGDSLRVRCRKFPSLVDCCGLDWFSGWPAEALVSVARSILIDTPDFPRPKTCDFENLISSLAEMCREVH